MKILPLLTCVLVTGWAGLLEAADASGESAKEMSGMSILGNSEAPKSLVIVPWKTSEIGDGIGVSNMLDGRALPVDKEVFVRELEYYQLRIGAGPQRASQAPATAAAPVKQQAGSALPARTASLAGTDPDSGPKM